MNRAASLVLVAFVGLAVAIAARAAEDGPAYLELRSTLLDDQGGLDGLDGAFSLAVSPDGLFVYAVGIFDDALSIYRHDPVSGELSLQKVLRSGIGPGLPFEEATYVALAPGGEQLYLLGADSTPSLTGQLAVYARDASDGSLELVEVTRKDFNLPADGLSRPWRLLPSRDGRHLYALSSDFQSSGRVGVYARNPADGRLTLVQGLVGPLELPTGEFLDPFSSAFSMAESRDGRFLYVAGFRGHGWFSRNAETGELLLAGFLAHGEGIFPSAFALSPDGLFAYTVNANGQLSAEVPGVAIFRRDPGTGALSQIATCCQGFESDLPLNGWPSLSFSEDGQQLIATAFLPSTMARFDRSLSDGLLTVRELFDSTSIPSLKGASDLARSRDGGLLYVASLESDSLTVLRPATGTGETTVVQALIDGQGSSVGGLSSPTDMVQSRDGRFVYVVSPGDDAVTVQELGADGSTLTQIQRLDPNGTEVFSGVRSLVLSPDGRHLYATGSGDTYVWLIDPATGLLEPSGVQDLRLTHPAITPDGALFFAGVFDGQSLGIFQRHPVSGLLEQIAEIDELGDVDGRPESFGRIWRMLFSADGRHLYLSDSSRGFFVLSVASSEPFLSLVQVLDGRDVPEERFLYPQSMALDPSGRDLYAAGWTAGIVLFRRDPVSGRLSYERHYPHDDRDGEPLLPARALVVAPDGLHLYAADREEDSVRVFVRNPSNGHLKLLEQRRNGVAGVDGLLNPDLLALSPNGQDLFVTTDVGGILSFAKRDLACQPGPEKLCLNGGRFHVEADWRTRQGATGPARRVDVGSGDSGLFWFFRPANWEMLVKVLDGCGVDQSFWVFSAATTNVEYTLRVTDSLTGLRRSFFNPLGEAAQAIAATGVFPACPLGDGGDAEPLAAAVAAPRAPLQAVSQAGSACSGTDSALCLNQGRFRVEVDWRTRGGATGQGRAVPEGSDGSGMLWFFNEANWEMLVKVLDGCANNGHFWVFAAATTNVEYTLRVTDTETGEQQEYFNPLNTVARAITDTEAFSGCQL